MYIYMSSKGRLSTLNANQLDLPVIDKDAGAGGDCAAYGRALTPVGLVLGMVIIQLNSERFFCVQEFTDADIFLRRGEI